MTMSVIKIARRAGVVAALILTTLVFILLCVGTLIEQAYRLQTRTVHERQFSIDPQPWQRNLKTIQDFEARHELNPEANGGLRLNIDEWPSWKYIISIETLRDGAAKGAIQAIAYDEKGPVFERDFHLEKEEASLFFRSFDRELDGYWGSMRGCTDGTGFQFERWSRNQVSSGYGNAACQRHYADLMALVAETLVVKLTDVPFDWRSWFRQRQILILSGHGDEGGMRFSSPTN
jgi:hypothetical protein